MNDADCNGSMLGRVGASDVMRNSRDGRPLPAVRYVNRLIVDLVNGVRDAPILGNNYVQRAARARFRQSSGCPIAALCLDVTQMP
jgi:hypothetical protein